MSTISISLLCISLALLIAVVISRLVKKGEKIDESMTKSMPLGSLIAFSLKNAAKNFSEYLLLITTVLIPLGIGVGITFLLPSSIKIAGWLLVLLITIIISFGFLKNILNLYQNKKMDMMVFVKLKQKPILNLAIVLMYFLLIYIGMHSYSIYQEIYDNTLLILSFLVYLCFYFFLLSIFAPFLVIDRNFGPIEAIKESIKLTKGHRLKIFLVNLLVIVLAVLLMGFTDLLISIIFAVIDYHPYNIEDIKEVEVWESVIFCIYDFFLFLFFCANAYLHLTGQLNEFDETKGEMRNEP